MSYQDFMKNFEKVEICNLDPEYTICLEDPDEGRGDGKCTCMIGLMQKHRRRMKKEGSGDLLFIGYALYKADNEVAKPLDREYFRTHVSSARSTFMNLREVTTRFRLPAGEYVVVPSTFAPNDQGEFMLRMFSESKSDVKQCEEDTGYTPVALPPEASVENDTESSDKLDAFFQKLSGQDLEIDAWELQKVLTFALKKEFDFEEFSLDTCRSMIACVDLSRSGKLELEEFKGEYPLIT